MNEIFYSTAVKTIFLIFLLSKGTLCSVRESKLYEFRRKLQHKTTTSLASTNSISPKSIDGVFYPIAYGADPTGARDSSAAIMEAISDAVEMRTGGLKMLPGIADLGGVVIDLQGGNFLISSPIRFQPGIGNIVMQGGTLRASPTFNGNSHLVELCPPDSRKPSNAKTDASSSSNFYDMKDHNNDGMKYEDITFRDILFDSSYRGGGLYMIDSIRIRVVECFFLRFTTQGILIKGGHEMFVSNCFLGQHPTDGGDPDEKNYNGVGIDIASTDNAVTDVAVFSAMIGIRLQGNANILTGVHCYNKARGYGGVGILVESAQNRIVSPYLDYNSIEIIDPDQVHVSKGFFYGDGNVVLKSRGRGRISGLSIVDNIFCGKSNDFVSVEVPEVFTSIDQVVIDRNVATNGLGLRSTVAKKAVSGNGTKWTIDFSRILLFPNKINHVEYALYRRSGSRFTANSVTKVSNNVVVIESEKAVDAVVSVSVDQYNEVGEGKL